MSTDLSELRGVEDRNAAHVLRDLLEQAQAASRARNGPDLNFDSAWASVFGVSGAPLALRIADLLGLSDEIRQRLQRSGIDENAYEEPLQIFEAGTYSWTIT